MTAFDLFRILTAALISGFCLTFCAVAEPASKTELKFSLLRHMPANTDFNDICCGALAKEFAPVKEGKFLTGFGENVYWLRIDKLSKAGVLDLGTMLDKVLIYRRNRKTGVVFSSQAGDSIPVSDRELVSGSIAFPVNKSDLSKEIFFQIIHPKTLSVSPQLIDRASFENNIAQTNLIHAGLAGAVFMIMIFNILLGLLIRQILFLLNAATMFSFMITHLYFTGLGPAYIWGDYSWLSNSLFDITAIVGIAIGMMFFYTFMKTDGENPTLVKFVLFFPAFTVPMLVFWAMVPTWMSQFTITAFNGAAILYCLFVATVLSFKGYKRARLMLPALLLALIPGNILFLSAKFFSVNPIIPVEHIYEFTMIVEALTFSLILAYRVRLAENEASDALSSLKVAQQGINQRLIRSIDDERKRIASDLHDTAGQGLIAITTRLRHLVSGNKFTKTDRNEITKVADYSREVVGEIRRISHDLHPAIIDHLGWKNAIEELFATLSDVEEISVDLHLDINEDQLDQNQKIHLYRIVQEIISNIAKHANAKVCNAQFSIVDKTVHVTITDNGLNSGLAGVIPSTGISLGHTIIEQRTAVLGGEWSIKRVEDKTIFQLSFPVPGLGNYLVKAV